jgi:uncharacterized protein YggE
MKQIPIILNAILAGVLTFLVLSVGLPNLRAQAAAQPTTTPQATDIPQPVCDSSRTVQVSGTAVVNVVPDRALIELGVQSNGTTPDAVQYADSVAIQKVIRALKKLGVEAKDIATDVYVIEPIYEDYDSLYIKGYRIHNMVAVTLRDVKKASAVIAAALKAGANQVVNVEFYTSELRKHRDQARDLAVKAAKEKAQALASAAGAETGCVLYINENTWSYYNGWWWWYGRNNQNLWTQNVVQNAAPSGTSGGTGNNSAGDGSVSLGQISIKAEVSVSFGLK